jgi:hypothetical protein
MRHEQCDSLRDSPYATELARGELADPKGDCFRIERLRVKATGVEEIRFSWWPKGMANKPLDLPEQELLELLREAIGRACSAGSSVAPCTLRSMT